MATQPIYENAPPDLIVGVEKACNQGLQISMVEPRFAKPLIPPLFSSSVVFESWSIVVG
jgi:hypothetical protein